MKALNAYDVIRRPLVTEKTTSLAEQNKVVFEVALRATKQDVAAAVKEIFGAEVQSVNTIRQLGKQKRFRGVAGKRSDFKKAIVTLKDGQNIDMVAGA